MSNELALEDCLDFLPGDPDCHGKVEYHISPDRDDMKAFPRCEHHWAKRLKSAERNMELLSDCEPDWFDPSYAGERWYALKYSSKDRRS